MSINYQALETILKEAGIDPDAPMPNGQNALLFLEGFVMSALDEIEEGLEESDNS